ncbi:Lrp/AsnC family transcriptional regulator [Pseudoalteromonas sp.]|jgi:Lrp/AsnC family transcriptional regulator, leucine-responsive regulatory protein|uniref:Lrp/AsnC family transcriptional regulator n=1 Tax=Pseudoalteromonas sp. TaxID=53249 RepID=UPI003561DAC9
MLDKKDQQLLTALQACARTSVADLAASINLSDTPCLRRIKKLEQANVITGYHAAINPKALQLNVLVYAFIRLNQNSVTAAEQFERQVEKLPHVLECSVISGSYDYLLKIIAHDLESYEQFVKHQLGSLSCIANIESTVVLKQSFSKKQLPL